MAPACKRSVIRLLNCDNDNAKPHSRRIQLTSNDSGHSFPSSRSDHSLRARVELREQMPQFFLLDLEIVNIPL